MIVRHCKYARGGAGEARPAVRVPAEGGPVRRSRSRTGRRRPSRPPTTRRSRRSGSPTRWASRRCGGRAPLPRGTVGVAVERGDPRRAVAGHQEHPPRLRRRADAAGLPAPGAGRREGRHRRRAVARARRVGHRALHAQRAVGLPRPGRRPVAARCGRKASSSSSRRGRARRWRGTARSSTSPSASSAPGPTRTRTRRRGWPPPASSRPSTPARTASACCRSR